ncbi:MAG: DUF309 domain-containing protein [Sulfolobales archaeon]
MHARYLFIVANDKDYKPQDREHLLKTLRRFFTAPNIRIGSKHIEIEVWDPDLSSIRGIIEENVGRIVEWKPIDAVESNYIGDEDLVEAYVALFNQERFWEAHGALETLWRRSGDRNAQGLILVAAAFIKIQENKENEFISIAKRALEMLKGTSYFCIDLGEVREKLSSSLESKKPFKIECTPQR